MHATEFMELRAFAAILRFGTFARAAAHLGISASALSQIIRRLEDRLGQRLLNRTTRSVSPTEVGQRIAGELLPALDTLDAVALHARQKDGAPSGLLRINSSRYAAHHVLSPLVAKFLARYPSVSLEIDVDDSLVDIVAKGFDAGLRLGERLQNDMIAVQIGGPARMCVVGAPSYFKSSGIPREPSDLAAHRCIGMRWPTDRSLYKWEFEKGRRTINMAVDCAFVCDDPVMRLNAAADGVGLAYVFEAEAAQRIKSGELRRVLEDWTPPFPGCFLYYPGRRHVTVALRAFIDFATVKSRKKA